MQLSLTAAALSIIGAAVRPAVERRQARRTSDDPALDARRRRADLARMPGWLDQRDALRQVNGMASRWI